MKSTYHGGCHCAVVRFECALDLTEGTSRCDCSICARSRLWKWLERAPKGRNATGVWWRRHDEYDKR
jgi:hypothetical protein